MRLNDAARLFWYALRGGQEDALRELRMIHSCTTSRTNQLRALGVRDEELGDYLHLGVEAAMNGASADDVRWLLMEFTSGQIRRNA